MDLADVYQQRISCSRRATKLFIAPVDSLISQFEYENKVLAAE